MEGPLGPLRAPRPQGVLQTRGLGCIVHRIWLWAYYTKIPIYPIFYLLKGDYRGKGLGFTAGNQGLGFMVVKLRFRGSGSGFRVYRA